ncbi:choice-of-anchor I family protein [Falsiroseomonas oryzae]|uniref:choice-of-anchor I family protein n=1 Tax=Falsiroseomonas oryzae TaxID=2766473 RepID=UPI0022EB8364|nr:choice-of-anchor I family protein [Roseomonas sp. MO-31]
MSSTLTPSNAINITPVASLNLPGAEIAAFDPGSDRLFVTSNGGLQVINLSNPAAPSLVATLNFTAAPYGFATTDVTSVAVKGGIVAVALPAASKAANGQVIFLNAADGALLGSATVGALPDSLTFTPDGTKVLVANEGEYLSDGTPGGKGSVSIIAIDTAAGFSTSVQTAGFTAFDGQEAALRAAGVRIFAGNSVSDDVEPEYVAISADGTRAMVTLQEANAVGLLDIATATFTGIVPLGTKDFSTLLADFSDRDGAGATARINLTTGNPVLGLYMPDAIDSYEAGGQTYYVIANEGDDRDDFLNPDETIRLGNAAYDLDDVAFPNEAALKANAALGRLVVSNATGLRGDTDGDGDIDQILTYGARSFSILDSNGAIVFDSADLIERIASKIVATATFDDRSDNKGPEPEGIEIGEVDGRIYAFVGLERSHVTLAFDVTDPTDVSYAGIAQRPGDLNPEGGLFISATDSPTGEALFVSTNEVSNNISVFQVTPAANFTLQLLHFADAEAGLLASQTAPNLAALVDAFDGQYANTLILAGGDNYIPGPFLNAGTDPVAQAVHGRGGNLGAADIEIHNRIGVQASTIGNHEFDLGTREFRDNVDDALFPYLSANLDFTADGELASRYQETVGQGGLETAAALAAQSRSIAPSAVVRFGDEIVGLVGATTQILESISSTGGVEVKGFAGDGSEANDMALLAAQLQPVIDDLRIQGVDKIVLMAHLQQIAFEQALAPLLSGVDIILAAGSNTRLGDANDVPVAFPGHAANFANTYPILTTGADGGTTLIVNTDNEFTYLGRLVVEFDAQGNIIPGSLDPAINGAYAATTANVAAAWGVAEADLATTAFAGGTKGEQVADITEAVQAVINAKDGEIWGYTNVYLEGERSIVRNQETNFGNVTADANKVAAEAALGDGSFVASLKNGGGIRAQIGSTVVATGEKIPPIANPEAGKPAGAISTLDIENALRFDNKLMVFDTTPQGLKNIIEHGLTVLGNQGRFPQLGGVSISFDPNAAGTSATIRDVALIDAEGTVVARVIENGAISGDAPALIRLVTLNFLANGGDGYPMRANGENFRYLLADGTLSAIVPEGADFADAATLALYPPVLGEQQAFKTFLQANHATPQTAFAIADTPAAQDTRIQNVDIRTSTVLDGETLPGTAGLDTIDGTAGDDVILGGARDDLVAGLAGQDSIDGGAGSDDLDGGTGADTIDGGAGNDVLKGGAANDTLTGGLGADTLDGGTGDDSMAGGLSADAYFVDSAGDVVLESGAGIGDTVFSSIASYTLPTEIEVLVLQDGATSGTGNAKANLLVGNQQGNTLDGAASSDTLRGEGGDDLLIGGLGLDSLEGGMGADTLVGGRREDVLTGGAGNDVFRFDAEAESAPGARDEITDFVRGEDKLLLAFDANRLLAGIQDFAFTSEPFAAFTPGFLRIEAVDATSVRVLANTDADAEAEFELLVRGTNLLDASDLL